jgi:hypothetical protein
MYYFGMAKNSGLRVRTQELMNMKCMISFEPLAIIARPLSGICVITSIYLKLKCPAKT